MTVSNYVPESNNPHKHRLKTFIEVKQKQEATILPGNLTLRKPATIESGAVYLIPEKSGLPDSLSLVGLPANVARSAKAHLKVLVLFQVNRELEDSWIHAHIMQVWLFDSTTGQVFAKFDAFTGRASTKYVPRP